MVQRDHVQQHQCQQQERHQEDVEHEEPVQSWQAGDEVSADPGGDRLADVRDRGDEVDDDGGAPIGHLPPGKQVAQEGFRRQDQVDPDADDPQDFTRPLVGAVQYPAVHVQIGQHEERRRAHDVEVADQPSPAGVPHDPADHRPVSQVGVGLVVHGQEQAGRQLDHQHDDHQRAEEIPDIEVLRRRVTGQVFLPCRLYRQAFIEPAAELAWNVSCRVRHHTLENPYPRTAGARTCTDCCIIVRSSLPSRTSSRTGRWERQEPPVCCGSACTPRRSSGPSPASGPDPAMQRNRRWPSSEAG